ncbi:hypothetical protein CDD82_2619 [Ophiocordyceps australis]|uniref:GATA-type domain-containing protein n=1 Tax=Ophiocordyceps australis TaxID=1399860 RepID=A0A2C5ZDG7_9HYPO|nr:hypothetical protein CDD82_2619 [Ophiocordyceps australis]
MATATVLAPSSHYPPQSSFTVGHHHSAMMASEPRRSCDDHDPPNRQSLPSISEVISGTRPAVYAPSAAQPAMRPGSGLPSPFSQSSLHYSDLDKRSSPQPLHPASSFAQPQEPLPAFADSPRPPFNGRHSLPPVADRRPTPPTKSELSPTLAHKPSDSHASNGSYSHQPPPPAPTSHPYPPGQVPLPNYPISPRHSVPLAPGRYDARPNARHAEEGDFNHGRARCDGPVGRNFETWSYYDALSRIAASSRTMFNFAEAYARIAIEQHGSQPIPERLPTDREISDMLSHNEAIHRSLEQVRDAVQVSMQNERAREGVKIKTAYDEDSDVPMYTDAIKPQYSIQHEAKKRRGRAAPPGRCHSCNRIDTPEWRRGPDGARTLCNACGLHYAKLERKRQLEARTVRPKQEERN